MYSNEKSSVDSYRPLKVPSLLLIRITAINPSMFFFFNTHNTIGDFKSFLCGMIERKVDRELGDLGVSASPAIR